MRLLVQRLNWLHRQSVYVMTGNSPDASPGLKERAGIPRLTGGQVTPSRGFSVDQYILPYHQRKGASERYLTEIVTIIPVNVTHFAGTPVFSSVADGDLRFPLVVKPLPPRPGLHMLRTGNQFEPCHCSLAATHSQRSAVSKPDQTSSGRAT